jgi:Protein of unknown function (DUF998)
MKLLLLWLGSFCAPFFAIVFLIEGFTRPQYNWMRHPISSLSIGPLGWMQITNFVITGTLVALIGIGLRLAFAAHSRGSLFGPILLVVAGIGLIGAGIFVSDPVFGFPPDKPLVLAQFTTQGHFHDLFSTFWFLGLPAACFVLAVRFFVIGEPGWAFYSLLSGFGMIAFFVLASMGFLQQPGFVDVAGIYQRLSVATGLLWASLIAIHVARASA